MGLKTHDKLGGGGGACIKKKRKENTWQALLLGEWFIALVPWPFLSFLYAFNLR